MELDSRKNEAKADFKQQDILIKVILFCTSSNHNYPYYLQEVLNNAILSISERCTDVEEIKWENMRRSVGRYNGDYYVHGITLKACCHKG
jgi:hypothetical protein